MLARGKCAPPAAPHGEEALGCPPLDADGGTASGGQRWRYTPSGEVKDLARNTMTKGEPAGVCLSPDGGALFVNTGPFQQDTGTGL